MDEIMVEKNYFDERKIIRECWSGEKKVEYLDGGKQILQETERKKERKNNGMKETNKNKRMVG